MRKGRYVETKKHGEWISYRLTNTGPKDFWKTTYVHGERVHSEPDRNLEYEATAKGQTREKERQTGGYYDEAVGPWVIRYNDGSVWKLNYSNLNDPQVVHFSDGTVWNTYPDNDKRGRWIIRYPDGSIYQGPYQEGAHGWDERHGEWTFHDTDGTIHKGTFREDERITWVIRYPDGSSWQAH